jgi:hypothetical protein
MKKSWFGKPKTSGERTSFLNGNDWWISLG